MRVWAGDVGLTWRPSIRRERRGVHEEVSSVPRNTENVREIVLSGITMYETEQFEKVQKLLRNEVDDE